MNLYSLAFLFTHRDTAFSHTSFFLFTHQDTAFSLMFLIVTFRGQRSNWSCTRLTINTVGQTHDINFYITVNSCECHGGILSIMVLTSSLNASWYSCLSRSRHLKQLNRLCGVMDKFCVSGSITWMSPFFSWYHHGDCHVWPKHTGILWYHAVL